jgi:hypothetical protein
MDDNDLLRPVAGYGCIWVTPKSPISDIACYVGWRWDTHAGLFQKPILRVSMGWVALGVAGNDFTRYGQLWLNYG